MKQLRVCLNDMAAALAKLVMNSARAGSSHLKRAATATGLALVSVSASAATAPTSHAQEEVRIPAGDVILAGTLYRPTDVKRPLPAVVLGHGSAPVTREMNRFWVNTALRTGALAVLVFDRRGSGESTGAHEDWVVETTPSMFSNLASDMEHAVRWLAEQPGIDRNRLGLMGGSQAGWVMPLAASREPLIKFVIIGEGVSVPAGIEEAHGDYLDAVSEDGEANPTLQQMARADAFALDYIGPRGYDPSPVLEALSIPVLWIFGLYDGVIPVRQSIDRIGELQKAGRRNHELHIFPFGDHNFRNVFTGEGYDVAEVSREWLHGIGIMTR